MCVCRKTGDGIKRGRCGGGDLLPFFDANERRNGFLELLTCRVCLPCSMLRCLVIVGGQNSRPGIQ